MGASHRFWVLLLCLSACGDPIACPSADIVVIQSPSTLVTSDVDKLAPGVQVDVVVRTTLRAGDNMRLDVVVDGRVISTVTRDLDGSGTITFAGVTVPSPRAQLVATGTSAMCGIVEDSVTLDVTVGTNCNVFIMPAPVANAYYAPLMVLNAAADTSSAPGFQGQIHVTTRESWNVTVYASSGGPEQTIGTVAANAGGIAMFDHTFAEGEVSLRATCDGPDTQQASKTTTVFVDTLAPSCSFTRPAPGATITPIFDEDSDLANGVQMTLEAHADGNDVEGEPVTMTLMETGGSPMAVIGSPLDANGNTSGPASFMPATTPATFALAFGTHDHAGNVCSANAVYDVVYQGCDIQVAAPTGPITIDADTSAPGSQVDFTIQVATECAGRTVTSSCGSNSPSGIVPANGQVQLRATVCATSPCETQTNCTFDVTSSAGIQTSAATLLTFDDLGPEVSVEVVNPALACNAQITPASDIDPITDGVQISARTVAPGSATRTLDLTNSAGLASFDATNDVTVTLEPGTNTFVGKATDSFGNPGNSVACPIALSDLAVSFSAPAADGTVGGADGTVSGSNLTFSLCGTVNRLGASVTVRVDGGAPGAATVTGTTWCRTITVAESPPSHTVVANATAGMSFGSASLVLTVDLTPPGAINDFAASALDRRHIQMSWTAPSDSGATVSAYRLKYATVPLTDANFDAVGTELVTAPPQMPGAFETADFTSARAGVSYWLGVAALDPSGNRSMAAIAGPITPSFDQTGAIVGLDLGRGRAGVGMAIAHGRFNDDDIDDVAVAAPFPISNNSTQPGEVYVYFGSATGIPTTPSLVLVGAGANGKFGTALAAVQWSSATRDDLVVGAPNADAGRGHVYIFNGGSTFGSGTRSATTAEVNIAVNATTPGWFAGAQLGANLVSADLDGNDTLDLVAAAPLGGGAQGGIVSLYGPVTADVALSDVDTSGIGTATVELFKEPSGTSNRQFGYYLHAVGPTQGATDTTDDLLVAYLEDYLTANDASYILRGDGSTPPPGYSERSFAIGRDVRLEYVTVHKITEWASQATSIDDLDGDGARDLVIGAYRSVNGAGEVLIISGDIVGAAGLARTSDPGVRITTFNGSSGVGGVGSVIASHDTRTIADVDRDGLEDLIIGARVGTAGQGFVWYGGAIPTGATVLVGAPYAITGPSTFLFTRQAPQGPAGQARWIGDINGDGLDDVCWSSPQDNVGDGSFEILWDQ